MARPLTITNNGVITSTAQKRFGNSSAYFDISENPQVNFTFPNAGEFDWGTGDFTIEFWIWFEFSKSQQEYIESDNWVLDGISVGVDNDTNFRFIYNDGSNNFSYDAGNVDVPNESWNHIALVKNGTNLRFYVNGTALPSTTVTHAINSGSGDINVGGKNLSTAVDDYVDELRISDTARYTSSFTPTTSQFLDDSNTLLLMHFEGANGGTTLIDNLTYQGTANFNLTNGVTATGRIPPIIHPDGVTWDEIDTWETWYVNDIWTAAQKFESSINLSATGAILQLGSAELNLGTIQTTTAENFSRAEATLNLALATDASGGRILDGGNLELPYTWDETDTWDTFEGDRWEIPFALAEMGVRATGGYLIIGEATLNLATVNATAGKRFVGGSATLNLATVQIVAGESVPPTQGEAQLDIAVSLEATAQDFDRATAELNIVLGSTVDANLAHFGSAELPITIDIEADAQDFDRATAQIDMSMSITATPTRILSTVEAELPITLTQEVDVLNVKGGAANLDISLTAEQEARLFVGGSNTANIELGVEAEADDFDNAAALILTEVSVEAFAGLVLRSAEATLNLATIKIAEAQRFVGGSAELPISIDSDIFASEIPDIAPFELPITMATDIDADLTLDGRATLNLATVKLTDGNRFLGGTVELPITIDIEADSSITLDGKSTLNLATITITDGESRAPVRASATLNIGALTLIDGQLKLLDSDFVFKIYAENRILTPKSETRIYKPYSETRTITVDS